MDWSVRVMGKGLTKGLALMAAGLAASFFATAEHARAKTPGATYCFGGWCHRVSTLDEMHGLVGRRGFLKASYYDDCSKDRFNPCGLTSSGEVFRPDLPDNAASPIFPDGTVVLVYNPANKRAAVLRVNSAGPYRGDRRLDVSRATAEKLDFVKRGVAELMVTVLKSPEAKEARYHKLRRYETVPGYLGRFGSFDDAHDAALQKLNLDVANRIAALEDETGAVVPSLQRPAGYQERVHVENEPIAATLASIAPLEALTVADASEILVSNTAAAELQAKDAFAAIERVAVFNGISLEAKPEADQAVESAEPSPIGDARRGRRPLFASDPDSGVSDFTSKWRAFVAAARKAAEPKRIAGSGELSWLAWAEEVVHEARLKARAGSRQYGPLKRFTAELTLKARAYR